MKLPLRLSRGGFDIAVRETIESDPALSHAMLPVPQARRLLFDTFTELDRRVCKAAHADPVCQRFMGVHGMGEITALSFKAAVDETKGRRRAIVAVARKIAVGLHRIWIDGCDCRLGSEAAA